MRQQMLKSDLEYRVKREGNENETAECKGLQRDDCRQ